MGERFKKIKNVVYEICKHKSYSAKQLAAMLSRKQNTVFRNYLTQLREECKLKYTILYMPNHSDQANKSV